MSELPVVSAPETGLWRLHRRGYSPLGPAPVQPIDPMARSTLHTADSAVAAVGVALLPFRPEPGLAMLMREHSRATASETGHERQTFDARSVAVIPQAWIDSRTLSQLVVPPESVFIDATVAVDRLGFTIADLYGPPGVVATVRRRLRTLAFQEGLSIGGFSYPSRANERWKVFEVFTDQFEEIRFVESAAAAYRVAVEAAVELLGLTIEL